MNIEYSGLKIEFTSQEEIRDFWNIIMFALDLQTQREKEGKSCMTQDELKLAKTLESITHKSWEY